MKYILCAYSQLPHDTPSEFFDVLIDKFIKRLLKNLHSNPWMKILLHLSIAEYEYMETRAPELNMLIRELCRKDQIEILVSSFNDVILPLIPSHRRSLHIEKSVTYIRKLTGKRPRGFWCINQYFSPSMITPLSLCGIEYIVLSGFSQYCKCQIASSPFLTDDFGKGMCIFPFEDKYSVAGTEFMNGTIDERNYMESVMKIADANGRKFCTIALNMDHLLLCENGCSILEKLFDFFGQSCILPFQILDDSVTKKTIYIPDGIYGRDYDAGKTGVMLQRISEDPVKKQNYCLVNLFREQIKNVRKGLDVRSRLETMMLRAESSSVYMPEIFEETIRSSSRLLCEIESLLCEQGCLPEYADINHDGTMEIIAGFGNFICHLNSVGGTISRFVFIPTFSDICSAYGRGMFIDSFRNANGTHEVLLQSSKYEISTIDRKRIDFFANGPDTEFEKTQINISKRYKIRHSMISADIDIENIGSSEIRDCVYECCINLALSGDCCLVTSDGTVLSETPLETANLSCNSPSMPFSVQIALNEPSYVSVCSITEKKRGYLGERSYYHYTQIKIQKKLSLRPSDETNLVVGLRIEKRKETK